MSLTHNPAATISGGGAGPGGLSSPASASASASASAQATPAPATDTDTDIHHDHDTHPGTQSHPAAAAAAAPKPSKPQKVLACQLCQQRKVKCDRKFPCTNCVRSKAQCVPATLFPRQRRRRFPERELLARIRHYESVLQQHNIGFEPLHPPSNPAAAPQASSGGGGGGGGGGGPAEPRSESESPETLVECGSPDTARTYGSTHGKEPAKLRATSLWDAINQKNPDSDGDDDGDDSPDLADSVIKNAWDRTYRDEFLHSTNHHILFGSPGGKVDLSTLHPEQAKIFRLWQIYLDNVNPLLKVTHTPTLQSRIVDAFADLSALEPSLEALLFSIYCISVLSLTDEQCRALFGSPRHEVLSGYQFACHQALVNCNALGSSDHDCLTAMFLYLISIRPETDPRCLSSMLAVPIRIAQRLGYHSESYNSQCPPLEAEMRRRLWWSLAVFDNRICEMLDYKIASLAPTWDCRVPLNLNDFELVPDAKHVPPVHDKPTEAVFIVLRSEVSDFVRHCAFHLDFIDPMLTTVANAITAAHGTGPLGNQDLLDLQRRIEEKSLALCDPENPLHFMTIWSTRGYLARNLLLEHCARQMRATTTPKNTPAPTPPSQHPHRHHPQTHTQQQQQQTDPSAGLAYALEMLDCDTKLMMSPLTRGYRWHMHFHFPFVAYTYIVQHLRRKRPAAADLDPVAVEAVVSRAWDAMSDNYEARPMENEKFVGSPFFVLFTRLVMQAWEASAASRSEGTPVPRIVLRLSRLMELVGEGRGVGGGGGGGGLGDEPQHPAVMVDVAGASPMPNVLGPAGEGLGGGQPFVAAGGYPDLMQEDGAMDFTGMGMGHFWPTMDWGMMQRRRW